MKPVTVIASIVFMLVCVAHIVRLVLKVDVTVNGFHVPLCISVAGVVVTGILSVLLWFEGKQR